MSFWTPVRRMAPTMATITHRTPSSSAETWPEVDRMEVRRGISRQATQAPGGPREARESTLAGPEVPRGRGTSRDLRLVARAAEHHGAGQQGEAARAAQDAGQQALGQGPA